MESFFDSLETIETIYLGSDHAGFYLKETIKSYLKDLSIPFEDLGPYTIETKVDHPEYAKKVCEKVQKNPNCKGILVCGSGVGVAVAANKFKGIRCGLIHDDYTLKEALFKNNCNIIAFGGRVIGPELAKSLLDVFISNIGTYDDNNEIKLSEIEAKYK